MIRRFILDFAQSSSPHKDDDDDEEYDDDDGDDGDDDEEGDGEEDGDPCIQRGFGVDLGSAMPREVSRSSRARGCSDGRSRKHLQGGSLPV